jgi:hypothetical protein
MKKKIPFGRLPPSPSFDGPLLQVAPGQWLRPGLVARISAMVAVDDSLAQKRPQAVILFANGASKGIVCESYDAAVKLADEIAGKILGYEGGAAK